jgi:release factor glutamine methyltransferase
VSVTLHERLSVARTQLIAAGVSPDEATIDVDLYARRILGWDRARLIIEKAHPAPPELDAPLSVWLDRRVRHEPTAYIVGDKEFWGRAFLVTPDVLIPRPETEFIVEAAVELTADASAQGRAVRAADIGTGSGCIAVSIACERPVCQVVATDISAEALRVARANAARHGVLDRMTFVATSYLDGVAGPFDLLLANPPYVKETDKAGLSEEVLHEPDVALFGGRGGLRNVAGVLDTASARLRPGGWLVMEFGFGQEDDVVALVGARPSLRLDRTRADLQGLPRTAIIERL